MVYENGNIDEDALMNEIDADFDAGRWRWAAPEEDALLREAAGKALAKLEAEKRNALKKQTALISA